MAEGQGSLSHWGGVVGGDCPPGRVQSDRLWAGEETSGGWEGREEGRRQRVSHILSISPEA